jgi:hypothetical protein
MQAVAAVKVRCSRFSPPCLPPSQRSRPQQPLHPHFHALHSNLSPRTQCLHPRNPTFRPAPTPSQDGWAQHLPQPPLPAPASPAIAASTGPDSEPMEAAIGRPPQLTGDPAAGCGPGSARSPSTLSQGGRPAIFDADSPASPACCSARGSLTAAGAAAYASVLACLPPPPAVRVAAAAITAAASATPGAGPDEGSWATAASMVAADAPDAARELLAGTREPPDAGAGVDDRLGCWQEGVEGEDGDGLWGLLPRPWMQDAAGGSTCGCCAEQLAAGAGLEAEAEWALL